MENKINASNDVEKLETSHMRGRVATVQRSLVMPQEVKHRLTV